MAASDKPYRDQNWLDIFFAVTSILMLVSIVWMFMQDYNREFKTEQRKFRDVESALAQRLALDQIPRKTEFDEAEAAIAQAREARKTRDEEFRKIQVEIARLLPQKELNEQKYQGVKADLESRTSFYNIEVDKNGPTSDLAKRYKDEIIELEARLADAKKARDDVDDQVQQLRKTSDDIDAPLNKAIRDLKNVSDKFDVQVSTAVKKRWGMGDWIRTWPIIDGFASPIKIQQFTINDVPIDYNFKYVTRFDRCTTCHLGIDRPAYTREAIAQLGDLTPAQQEKLKEAHALMEKRKESVAGLPEAKSIPGPSALQLNQVASSTLTPARVSEYCAHPRLDLFVGPKSKHPAERFGCTSCHEGQGSGTSFTYASHTPNDYPTRRRWEKEHNWEAIHHWDFPMQPLRFVEATCVKCHYEITDLVSADNRIEAPKLYQGFNLLKDNGCFGCHEIQGRKGGRQVGPDIRLEPYPPREDLTPAEVVKLDADPDNSPGTMRKVGPSLYRLAEKTHADWTARWLKSPRDFRPDTRMPHFYGLSNNDKKALEGTGQEEFPDAEIQAVTYYLFHASNEFLKKAEKIRHDDPAAQKKDTDLVLLLRSKTGLDAKETKELSAAVERIRLRNLQPLVDRTPAGYKANPERGRQLFSERGCLACHSHQSTDTPQGKQGDPFFAPAIVSEAQFGPNLSQVAEKFLGKNPDAKTKESARVWLVQWILNPQAHSPRSRMPITHLNPDEATDLASWLLDQKAQDLGEGWDDLTVARPDPKVMKNLASVYLVRLLSQRYLDKLWTDKSLPEEIRSDLPSEEKDLTAKVDDHSLQMYLGRKAIGRLGCFACHEVPGFDTAKPIGVGLNEWGKKDPTRLAFEDIVSFVNNHYDLVPTLKDDKGQPVARGADGKLPYEKFYSLALEHHSREGFLNQKLLEPRSYDYNRIRPWDDRARMPQFKFARSKKLKDESAESYTARTDFDEAMAREAVATFILGLVAEPVPLKSINQPSGDRLAEVKGRQVLEKYNCAGCHLVRPGVFEFKLTEGSQNLLEAMQSNAQGNMKSDHHPLLFSHHGWAGSTPDAPDRLTAFGMPQKLLGDEEQENILVYLTKALRFQGADGSFKDLRAANVIQIPPKDMIYPPPAIAASREKFDAFMKNQGPFGGAFANILTKYLIAKDKGKATPLYKMDPNTGDSAEARAASPPILLNQGERTQPEWLSQFIANPEKVRRMTVLQMPKFNLSPDEAKILTNYFGAVDRMNNPGLGLTYPYEAIPQRESLNEEFWKAHTREYVARLKATKLKNAEGKEVSAFEQRLSDLKPAWEQIHKQFQDKLAEAKKQFEDAKGRLAEAKKTEESLKAEAKTEKDAGRKKELDQKILAAEEARKAEERAEYGWEFETKALENMVKESEPAAAKKNWETQEAYLADGFKLVVNTQLCLKCHQVGNLQAGQQTTQGPPLNLAAERLRPGWTMRWVSNPQRFLTYTSIMPNNFPSDKEGQFQELFVGSSLEQIMAARDALMAYPQAVNLPVNRFWALPLPGEKK